MYVIVGTLPELAFVVSSLGQHNAAPNPQNIVAAKRALRYLQYTRSYGLRYTALTSTLIGYCDSDWASDINTRKSTSGYAFILANAAITWKSRKQSTITLSSTELNTWQARRHAKKQSG